MHLVFLKVDILLQDSGSFLCEGSPYESTEPPGYRLAMYQLMIIITVELFNPLLNNKIWNIVQ